MAAPPTKLGFDLDCNIVRYHPAPDLAEIGSMTTGT
ncbi:MAG: hypothetical protein RLY31_512 [Bacteroidota bacterium]|jgi:hypothetical protein